MYWSKEYIPIIIKKNHVFIVSWSFCSVDFTSGWYQIMSVGHRKFGFGLRRKDGKLGRYKSVAKCSVDPNLSPDFHPNSNC